MKEILLPSLLAIATSWTAATSRGQSPFEGTWKMDVSSIQRPTNQKPDMLLLQNGVYECKSCPFKGTADGSDQPLRGVSTFNSAAINVRDDRTIDLTFKKDGKVVVTNHMSISEDDDLLTETVSEVSKTNGESPRNFKYVAKRISKGPAGSHLISGTWAPTKLESMSDNLTTWTYRFHGDQVTETTPGGESFTVKLNGPAAPMKGNPDVTDVSIKMLGDRTIQETDLRDGKVTGIMTMTISSDNKTARLKAENKEQSSTTEVIVNKQ